MDDFKNSFASYNKLEPPAKSQFESFKPLTFNNSIAEQFNQHTSTKDNSNPISPDNDESSTNYSDWFNPKTIAKIQTLINSDSQQNVPDDFEKAFSEAVKIDPTLNERKDFFIKTAKRESRFNSKAQNNLGYVGLFQINKDYIKNLSGLSVNEFLNNNVAQILAANKLYDQYLQHCKSIGAYDISKQKGYSDDAIVAGAWAGGAGGVKTYVTGKGNPSDSHHYNGKGGVSVGQLMEEFNS